MDTANLVPCDLTVCPTLRGHPIGVRSGRDVHDGYLLAQHGASSIAGSPNRDAERTTYAV